MHKFKNATVSKIIGLLLVLLVFTTTYGQNKNRFPYQLTKADIPAGFVNPGPFTKEEKSLSLSANQGVVTNKKLIASVIYENMDTRTFNRAFVASYIPNKHAENGLTVYIIEYKTPQMRAREQVKLPHDHESRYMAKGSYLFIVWADANDYRRQVQQLADKLKKRWLLTELKN